MIRLRVRFLEMPFNPDPQPGFFMPGMAVDGKSRMRSRNTRRLKMKRLKFNQEFHLTDGYLFMWPSVASSSTVLFWWGLSGGGIV